MKTLVLAVLIVAVVPVVAVAMMIGLVEISRDIRTHGLWPVLKSLVRTLLP